jgi:DNA invertase Pin-like site-specific DNA recombinase
MTKRGGWPAIGYRVAVDPVEAPRVREVFELVADGLSTRETGRRLGMHDGQVRRILHHEPYKQPGELRIVDPALWRRAHAQLAAKRPY